MSIPETLTPEALRPLLNGHFGAVLHATSSLPSTQDAARAAAEAGAGEGTVVLAETQTQGRGRHGNTWYSPPGAGIYLSLVLRPRSSAQQMLPLTLAFGLAVADAVVETCGLEPELRWPNDLLLEGRKFCGLLLESTTEAGALPYAILGVGINVARQAFPPALQPIATALEEHTPAPVPRLRLCAALLGCLEQRYRQFLAGASPLAEFERRCGYARGMEVTVGGTMHGVTAGLDEAGFLRLRQPDGSLTLITTGDVRASVGAGPSAARPRVPLTRG